MSQQELVNRIRAKYPEYATWDDNELTQRWIAKYPEYKSWLDTPAITASTAGEAFDKWAEEKQKQLAGSPSQKAQAVGGTLLDTLALTSRPAQAVTAGLNAKLRGEGGFLETAGKQLAGGDIKLNGKDLTDVTYGWKPTSFSGKVGKSLLNIGRDIVGVSGPVSLAGKAARLVPGAAKAMGEAPTLLKGLAQAPNLVENVIPNAVVSPIFKGIAKGAGTVARETFTRLPEKAQDVLNTIARSTVNTRAGVSRVVTRIGEEADSLKNELNAYTNNIYLKGKDKLLGLSGEALKAEKQRVGKIISGQNGEDVMYHVGNLHQANNESQLNQMGGRGTGHSGTGIYGYGNFPEIYESSTPKNIHKIDLSGYNLYKPQDAKVAHEFHDTMKEINNKFLSENPESVAAAKRAYFSLPEEVQAKISKADFDVMLKYEAIRVKQMRDARDFKALEKEDSLSTKIMKRAGYDGVDMRLPDIHLPEEGTLYSVNNGTYGTVLYRKPEELTSEIVQKDILTQARKEFAEKQAFKINKIKEWQQRLHVIGIKGAFADTLKNITDPSKFYHRVYALPPGNLEQRNVNRIMANIDKSMAEAAARGEAEVVSSFDRLKKAYLAKDKKAIETELGALEFTDKIRPNKVDEPSMAISDESIFKRRVLPEHLAQVFNPKTDIDTLLRSERSADNAFAAMEARVLMLEQQKLGRLPKPVSPKATDEFLDEADSAGLFKGLGNVIPDIRTDKVTYDYIAQKLGEVWDVEKNFLQIPANQWITNTWKTYKLFHPAAIVRNFIQGSSLAAQHGISQMDYIPAVRDAYRMASGHMADVPANLRKIYSRLNGSGTSLSLSDLVEPTAIKTFGAERAIPRPARKFIGKAWDNLGQSFRSTDDGLRIAMFNKKVQEFAGKELDDAIKNKDAVLRAFQYVDQNTIKYDDLPALARWMKLVNPFFAFTFRAPRQYIKAMVESPALAARFKSSGERESDRNLEGVSPAIKGMFKAQRNRLAEALNTFGGNIVIDSTGRINGVPSLDYIDMAPLSYAMRRPAAAIYNPTLKAQAVDIASQMSGLNLSSDAPPITPVGLAVSVAKAVPAFGGEGIEADKAKRETLQTLAPSALTQIASIIPPEYYEAVGATGLAKAAYPVRGSTPQRNFLTALGVKTKAETYEDIAKGFTAGTRAAISAPLAVAQSEADALYPYQREKNSAYVRARTKKIVEQGKPKINRILGALKGL